MRSSPTRAMIQPRPSRPEDGQALIELALMLPVLLLIMVGIVEFGRLAYFGIEVQNAAQAGAQYGAQSQITAADNAQMVQTAKYDAQDVPGLSATASSACYCMSSGSQTVAPSCTCSSGRLIQYVQVNTSATVNSLLHYYLIPSSFTVGGHANLRVSQ